MTTAVPQQAIRPGHMTHDALRWTITDCERAIAAAPWSRNLEKYRRDREDCDDELGRRADVRIMRSLRDDARRLLPNPLTKGTRTERLRALISERAARGIHDMISPGTRRSTEMQEHYALRWLATRKRRNAS